MNYNKLMNYYKYDNITILEKLQFCNISNFFIKKNNKITTYSIYA